MKSGKIINEVLGVPDNLYETSVQVYEKILKSTNRIKQTKTSPNDEYEVKFRGKFRISDYEFSTINLKLEVKDNSHFKEPEIASMSFEMSYRRTDKFGLKNLVGNDITLLITIINPEGQSLDFFEFFKKNKNSMISGLSHELKHAYDHFKSKFSDPKERSIYSAVSGKHTGVDALDILLHDIYFTTMTENLVRPSEIVADIKNNKISQKEFLKFLTNSVIYKNLKRISNFSYSNLRKQLENEIQNVDSLLKYLEIDITNKTKDERIDEVLELFLDNLMNWSIENYHQLLVTHPFEVLLGFTKQKQKVFDKFVQRQTKLKTPKNFFEFYEKKFNTVGNLMIRKIAKLYSIL